MRRAAVPVLLNLAVQSNDIADRQVRANGATEDVDGLRGRLIIVRLGRANPDPAGTLGKNQTCDVGHGLVLVRGQELVAIDLGNGQGGDGAGGGEEERRNLHLEGTRGAHGHGRENVRSRSSPSGSTSQTKRKDQRSIAAGS